MIIKSLIFMFHLVGAAPFPVTSSRLFLNPKTNAFLWPYNFELDLQKTPYELDLTKGDDEKWTLKSPLAGTQIFIRVKKLGPKEVFEKILKNSIREYEKGGFQIVSQQIGKKNPERGWIHLQDSSEKQMLQSFVYKDRTWAYMNCVGTKSNLKELKVLCESLSAHFKIRIPPEINTKTTL